MTLPTINAELTFLSDIGSSQLETPRILNEKYRPHLVVGSPKQRLVIVKPGTNENTEHYLGVNFKQGPQNYKADEMIKAELNLVYYPEELYVELQPGATFTIREGGKIVGYGTVITRNDKNTP